MFFINGDIGRAKQRDGTFDKVANFDTLIGRQVGREFGLQQLTTSSALDLVRMRNHTL